MRCHYHDLRDAAIALARRAKSANLAYQSQIDLARYYNWCIVARLQEG